MPFLVMDTPWGWHIYTLGVRECLKKGCSQPSQLFHALLTIPRSFARSSAQLSALFPRRPRVCRGRGGVGTGAEGEALEALEATWDLEDPEIPCEMSTNWVNPCIRNDPFVDFVEKMFGFCRITVLGVPDLQGISRLWI